MATIQTYIRDTNITNEDLLMGTSYISLNKYESRKFKVGDLKDYIVQQVNIDPNNLSLKSNGGLVRETDGDGNSVLAVDLGASNITGQLANSDLANSSITINGAAISLGGSVTTPNTQLSDAEVRSKISVTGGGASYNSSTGVITLPSQFTLAQNNVTNASVSGQTLTLTRESASDVTFTPTANDFTTTLKNKLDGIAAGAEVNVNADWNSSSGDSEILNKPTIPSGNQIIDWTASGAGTIHASNYVDNDTIYTLPAASSSALGGIKIGYTESGKNYPVELDSDKAYVNVPWTDTLYSLPLAASGTRGGVKIGYSENGKNYPVELDSEQMYVNVPWTDTTYTLPTASSTTLGGVKVGGNLTIDGNGVLNVGAIALTTVQEAANQTAHLNLTTQEGDIVVRTDENKSYVRNSGTAGDMTDYTLLRTPTDAVLSVTTTDGTYINLTPNSAATGAINVTADLSAVNGTADNTARFLTKDNTWAVPAYTTDTNTFRTVTAGGNTLGATETLAFTAGSNVTISENAGAVTIASTDTNTNQLTEWILRDDDNDDKTVAHNKYVKFTSAVGAAGTNVSGTGTTSDPFVIAITSPNDNDNTTYTAGTGLSLSGTTFNANVDGTQTVAANTSTTTANRTYKVQVDSNDNLVVNVPWVDTDTDTNTFRTVEVDGSAIGATETLDLVAGNNITLTESNGEVTIDATDTNTQLSTEQVQDIVGGMVSSNTETNIAVTYDDANGKLNFASTDTNTTYTAGNGMSLSGTQFSADINYLSYSGTNNFIDNASDQLGSTIPTQGRILYRDTSNSKIITMGYVSDLPFNNYSLPTASSSTFGGVKIGYTENGKNYPVELSNGQMFVNVPWTDTNTQVTNHITNNADDTATGVYSFTNTGNHRFGAGGNGNIYVGNVISASAADKGFRIHSNNADVYFDYRTDSTGSHFYRQYDGSGGIHTRFEHDITSGVFRASSDIVAYYSFSDIRLKENIKPTNYGLNELLKLNPVEFKWKEKDGKEIGLIAQEVEEIVPEIIKENKRINDDTLYKQVDYEKLVPVLINSIKELNERIKKLEDGSTS